MTNLRETKLYHGTMNVTLHKFSGLLCKLSYGLLSFKCIIVGVDVECKLIFHIGTVELAIYSPTMHCHRISRGEVAMMSKWLLPFLDLEHNGLLFCVKVQSFELFLTTASKLSSIRVYRSPNIIELKTKNTPIY